MDREMPQVLVFVRHRSVKVSILIPAYNEAATVAEVLDCVLKLPLADSEVIVVDDASTDATPQILAEYAAKQPQVRVLTQKINSGKTAAISAAIREASGDILVIQDADLEYDPAEIPDLVAPILEDRADVVYGSRFMVKRAARVLYFYHYLANKTLTFLSNMLTNRNMSDIETCYKAFRREVIRPLELRSRGFGMEVEITAAICQTEARTFEVPISYYGRTYEEGKKIGWRDGVAALYYILYFNLIHSHSRAAGRYVREVNTALRSRRRVGASNTPAPLASPRERPVPLQPPSAD